MKKALLLTISILLTKLALADTPLPPPEDRRVCNNSVTYCAYISDTEDSVIYKVTNNFVLEKEYTIKGWHRSFYISPNGQFVVIGYWGPKSCPSVNN